MNAWNLYCRHFSQYDKPKPQMLSLLSFSGDLVNSLIDANKHVFKQAGRLKKISNCDNQQKTKQVSYCSNTLLRYTLRPNTILAGSSEKEE